MAARSSSTKGKRVRRWAADLNEVEQPFGEGKENNDQRAFERVRTRTLGPHISSPSIPREPIQTSALPKYCDLKGMAEDPTAPLLCEPQHPRLPRVGRAIVSMS